MPIPSSFHLTKKTVWKLARGLGMGTHRQGQGPPGRLKKSGFHTMHASATPLRKLISHHTKTWCVVLSVCGELWSMHATINSAAVIRKQIMSNAHHWSNCYTDWLITIESKFEIWCSLNRHRTFSVSCLHSTVADNKIISATYIIHTMYIVTVHDTTKTTVFQSHNNQVNKYIKQNKRQDFILSYTWSHAKNWKFYLAILLQPLVCHSSMWVTVSKALIMSKAAA